MAGILIVAPHADDEVLGCGGFIAKSKDRERYWLVCAKEDSKPHERVREFCGFTELIKLDQPDGRFDEHPFGDIVSRIAGVLHRLKPDTVLMPFHKDIHSDHRVIAEAVLAVCKPFRAPFVRNLLMYETLSQTNFASEPFVPTYFVDITDTLDAKMRAAALYGGELMDQARGVRDIEALATYRGTFINRGHAEAYQVVRMIQ